MSAASTPERRPSTLRRRLRTVIIAAGVALLVVVLGTVLVLVRLFDRQEAVTETYFTAITQADELHETRRRLAALEAELASLKSFASTGDERSHAIEARLAEGVHKAAERIEELARSLNTVGQG